MLTKHDATCLAYALTILTDDFTAEVVQRGPSSHETVAVIVYDTSSRDKPCAQLYTLSEAITYIRASIAADVIHEAGERGEGT